MFEGRPCPNECDGHGKCLDGFCKCNKNFIGNDCSTSSKSLQINENVTKTLPIG